MWVHFPWENDNIPVSIVYSSAPINIMTNPEMVSSEKRNALFSCSLLVPTSGFKPYFLHFLPGLCGPMHYYLMPRNPREEEPAGRLTAFRKPEAAARVIAAAIAWHWVQRQSWAPCQDATSGTIPAISLHHTMPQSEPWLKCRAKSRQLKTEMWMASLWMKLQNPSSTHWIYLLIPLFSEWHCS